ncbi:MAG: hypothetical protein II818_00055 [Aeriscardovia sp.]|nr:hypothetical protein [Aeriscardovia sp.]
MVDKIINSLGNLTGNELGQKSHNEEPWSDLREGIDLL